MADTLTHAGYHMIQDGTTIGSGTRGCTKICCRIQCYGLLHTYLILDLIIEWYIGLCNNEQWPTEEHKGICGVPWRMGFHRGVGATHTALGLWIE